MGRATDFKRCTRSECSIQSVWASWGSWSTCSNSCGGGNRERVRQCVGEHRFPSVVCGEQRREMEVCNIHACDSYNWAEWGEWSQCPDNLAGKQIRTRQCESPRRDARKCNGEYFSSDGELQDSFFNATWLKLWVHKILLF